MSEIFPGRSLFAGRRVISRVVALIAGVLLACGVSGCSTPTREQAKTPPPGPTYRGPEYLRGTVGSLTQLRNDRPLLVSGYGLIVGLHDTGSSEVPAFLRQFMINQMLKRGFGSASLGTRKATPQRVLADKSTAVVAVRGVIPPGALEGTHFDVLVSALSGTQTTSLAGGRLYTTDLTEAGIDPSLPFMPTRATAYGPVFLQPWAQHHAPDATQASVDLSSGDQSDFVYNAVILSGGTVSKSRPLLLALNQPSWVRSRQIADRINERFPAPPDAQRPTANAINDLIIRINIPDMYATDPGKLIGLIQHLFIQRGLPFATHEAATLMGHAMKHPEDSRDVMLTLVSLGRTIIPVLREHYIDPNMSLRMTALEAGARLGDERAGRYLDDVVKSADPGIRVKVARALAYLPTSLRASVTLQRLVNDPSIKVRLAAYESLRSINDPSVDSLAVHDRQGNVKFVIDRVPCKRPLVYITQKDLPRIVIFSRQLGFAAPMFDAFWNNHLMLRQKSAKQPLSLFYQLSLAQIPPKTPRKQRVKLLAGKRYKLEPTVATLAYILGHDPSSSDNPGKGLGMTYSQVVQVIYGMCKDGSIDAPVQLHVSKLAKRVSEAQQRPTGRPMISDQPGAIRRVGGKFQVPAGPTSQPKHGGQGGGEKGTGHRAAR